MLVDSWPLLVSDFPLSPQVFFVLLVGALSLSCQSTHHVSDAQLARCLTMFDGEPPPVLPNTIMAITYLAWNIQVADVSTAPHCFFFFLLTPGCAVSSGQASPSHSHSVRPADRSGLHERAPPDCQHSAKMSPSFCRG